MTEICLPTTLMNDLQTMTENDANFFSFVKNKRYSAKRSAKAILIEFVINEYVKQRTKQYARANAFGLTVQTVEHSTQ